MITKVEKKHSEMLVQIGDEIHGYSGMKQHGNPLTGASVSFCRGNTIHNSDQRLISVDLPLYLWRIEITDPIIIERICKEPKDQWADLAVKIVMEQLTPDQLFGLMQHTTNLVFEKGVAKGRKEKLAEVHEVLGLDRLL